MKKQMAIILLFVFAVGLINGCSSKENKQQSTQKEQNKEPTTFALYDEKENGEKISQMSIEMGKEKIQLPCTVKELETFGLRPETSLKNIKADTETFWKFLREEKFIFVKIKNLSEVDCPIEDCYVTYVSSGSNNVYLNGINIEDTTYEDVLGIFGRDKEERSHTYEEFLKEENLNEPLTYCVSVEEQSVGNKSIKNIYMKIGISTEKNCVKWIDIYYEF